MAEYNGVLYAGVAPEGVTPDFNNPSNVTSLAVSIYVLLPISVITVLLRATTRVVFSHRHGWDDVIMEAAVALTIAMCVIIILMFNEGLGKNLWDVPVNVLFPGFMLKNLIIAMIFCAATTLAKISILLMYLRIFTSKGPFRYAVFATIFFIASYGLASVLSNLFSCSPIRGSWDFAASQSAKCIDRPKFYLAQASLGIVADVATVSIPLPVVFRLNMDLKKKLGVVLLLTLGGFVCVVSMIRLKSLIHLMQSPNLTRATPNALMWCVLELTLSIIAGSVPAIKPLLRRYVPFLVSATHMRSRPNPSYDLSNLPNSTSASRGKPKIPLSTVSVQSLGGRRPASDSVEELVGIRKTITHTVSHGPN